MYGQAIDKHRAKVKIAMEEGLEEVYPEVINFYTALPTYSISIIQFEEYAMERLKMLSLLEKIKLESCTFNSNEHFNEFIRTINKHKNEIQTYYALFSPESDEDMEVTLTARKIDHIAHFLLRLVFSRNDEQRQWFIAMEVDLFRLKLHKLVNFNNIIRKYSLPYELVNENEKDQFRVQISNASFILGPPSSLDCPIYKTSFIDASDLVRKRKVFLHRGFAYLPLPDLAGIISLKFKSYLSESLSILEQNRHVVENDERVRRLVYAIQNHHSKINTGIPKSEISVSATELHNLAEKSFPLCMKHLYEIVIRDNHVRHWGRLQLGLFFKGLGLPMQEAIKFWRKNFTKRADIDIHRFDSQYLYNVRHMYGHEGKRTDYTPYNCMRIINFSIGPGDHHGCPFKHSDNKALEQKLMDAGIPVEGLQEIKTFIRDKRYQLACQRYFEWTNDKRSVESGVNHPNQYFVESLNAFREKNTTEGQVKTNPAVIYKNDGSRTRDSVKQQKYDNIADEFIKDELDEVLASMELEKY